VAGVVVAAIVVALILAFTWFDVSLSDGVGDRNYAPDSAGAVRRVYKVGVGSLKLDLSRIGRGEKVRVEARVGIGELRVIVPPGATLVDARVKAGSVSVLGHDDDGRNARVRVTGSGGLDVTARVGAGSIDVVR
jgi:hypothetical protein